jgi:transcriptional regulator with XRE-family HTH domain
MDTSRPLRQWTVRSPDDLGRAIAGVRKEAGLSQEDLAAELDLHRPQVSKLESGNGPMAIARVLRMLRRMGATVTITMPRADGED